MKTQISRISHRPEKRSAGVYQQQGRMITDADWNELMDLAKERLADVFGDVIGTGIPRRNGLAIVRENDPENDIDKIRIHPGCLYVDGIRGEISHQAESPLIDFDQQADFPLPEGACPGTADLVYADLWERPVVALEDLDLLDPGLHGEDTCTRTI